MGFIESEKKKLLNFFYSLMIMFKKKNLIVCHKPTNCHSITLKLGRFSQVHITSENDKKLFKNYNIFCTAYYTVPPCAKDALLVVREICSQIQCHKQVMKDRS